MKRDGEEVLVRRLRDLLWKVHGSAGEMFSGLGLVVSDRPDELPIIPLRDVSTFPASNELACTLARISVVKNEFHDGFHVVSSQWQLTRVAQYFSPPIVRNAVIDRHKAFGGRYIAALFGSAIPSVLLTGIASRGFGVAIFVDGRETYFEQSHD